MLTQFEREEEAIEEAYRERRISLQERNAQMRELQRDYRAAAQESAERAYDDEMARW